MAHARMSTLSASPHRLRRAEFELVPAVHTPFDAQGSLALDAVAPQAAFLAAHGIQTVFVAGTTGEGLSLRESERAELAAAWVEAAAAHDQRVWVHVGSNNVAAPAALASAQGGLGSRKFPLNGNGNRPASPSGSSRAYGRAGGVVGAPLVGDHSLHSSSLASVQTDTPG